VEAVWQTRLLVEELEEQPPSPKRDQALLRLRELLGDAIRQLGNLGVLIGG
jgi:hypothetical protein